jgi:hypothetical protein
MILIVKGKDYRKLALKILSYVGLIIMFYLYYNHMSEKFKQTTNALVKKLNIKEEDKKAKLAKTLEKLIYKEAEMVVDLLGQSNIQDVKIVNRKYLLYVITIQMWSRYLYDME